MKKNLYKYLAGNEYPGRGIVLGQSPDGSKVFVAYWIMGRSANSRNRVFEPIEGGIRTVAADPAKLEDPHLIIYNAVLTGATVHLVNEECDGGPILLQKAVAVQPGDTPETLQKRVMVEAEWQLLPKALAMVCSDEV